MDDSKERIEPGLMRRVLARIGRKGGQAREGDGGGECLEGEATFH